MYSGNKAETPFVLSHIKTAETNVSIRDVGFRVNS